jgi:prepilin-type N-terminal cleavage/methylation domain-containing protein
MLLNQVKYKRLLNNKHKHKEEVKKSMKNLLKNKAGFTMVELMVVVIIVAILAAAAIPLYTANIKRAIRTEAEATLGAIRAAERIYKAENNVYSASLTATQVNTVLGIDTTDARYFDNTCYTVTGVAGGGTTFTATCTSLAGNGASGAAQALKYFAAGTTVETMDQTGVTVTP